MPYFQHLLINSDHRNFNQSSTFFSSDFPNNVDDDKLVGCSVLSLSCPNLFNNVYDPFNKLFLLNETTNDVVSLTVPPLHYNSLSLSSTLQNLFLSELGWTTTVSISTVKFNLFIVPTVGKLAYRFLTHSEILNLNLSENFTLNYYLGGNHINIPNVWPTELENPVNLLGPREIYFISAAISHSSALTSNSLRTDFIGKINLSKVPYGSMATTETQARDFKTFNYRGDRSMSSVDIKIVDHWGNELFLPNNYNVSVELHLIKHDAY